MAEHLILYNYFNVKHDGNIDFLINQKTFVQESIEVSVFFTSGKKVPLAGIEPGSPDPKSDVLTTILLRWIRIFFIMVAF